MKCAEKPGFMQSGQRWSEITMLRGGAPSFQRSSSSRECKITGQKGDASWYLRGIYQEVDDICVVQSGVWGMSVACLEEWNGKIRACLSALSPPQLSLAGASGRSGTETENRSDGGAIPAGPEEPLEDARLDTQRWRRGLREPRTGQPEPGSWSNGFGSNAEAWQIYCTSICFHYEETEPVQPISVAPSQTREHISLCRGPIDDAPSVIVPIHTYGVSVHSFVCW
ncbi:hypothetical protein K456DRAFT_1908043 [Colletotrichum gloeosporioides 23]|nr:hypothetical protein K456DRAFT_1908043 [Colletotrichum gloeosporioides 23]